MKRLRAAPLYVELAMSRISQDMQVKVSALVE
jgi:hypothetical protein